MLLDATHVIHKLIKSKFFNSVACPSAAKSHARIELRTRPSDEEFSKFMQTRIATLPPVVMYGGRGSRKLAFRT